MSTNKKPQLHAFGIVERKGKDRFVRIGAAWPTQKGGFTIRLDALPLSDTIVLAVPREDDDAKTE